MIHDSSYNLQICELFLPLYSIDLILKLGYNLSIRHSIFQLEFSVPPDTNKSPCISLHPVIVPMQPSLSTSTSEVRRSVSEACPVRGDFRSRQVPITAIIDPDYPIRPPNRTAVAEGKGGIPSRSIIAVPEICRRY